MDEANVIDNLLHLGENSEKTVVTLLENCFKRKRIYTKLGNVLIAVNPNERLPIYDDRVIDLYKKESTNEAHLFTAAEQAYLGIREGAGAQNIVFSGESGSGKTFNARAALKYLAAISCSSRNRITTDIIDAIYTVLSSFASAKTMKNDTSTRFGYTVELLYRSASLEGLSIKSALPLDLTRLANRPNGERNFNVLHELCAGLSTDERASYGVKADHKFFYLSKDTVDDERDRKAFKELINALEKIGFTEDQRQFVLSVLSAILHIGNIYFALKKTPNTVTEVVYIANEGEIKWAANLLGVDYKKLGNLFTEKKIITEGGSSTVHYYSMDKALDTRDSFAAVLYEELFNWLLSRISHFFKCNELTSSIAILDYYGVERYNGNNSLDQLLVNTANEYIENFILHEIFDKEYDSYSNEKICFTDPRLKTDNSRTVEVLTKKPYGILPLLDDECKFPKASDESYLQHANLNHLENGIYGKARNKDKAEFSIQHFHGTTWYSVNNFLSTNRRSINRELLDLLAESSNGLVSFVFRSIFTLRTRDEHTQLAASTLLKATHSLIDKLKSGTSQFVRCIRSNSERTIGKWDGQIVTRQLRAYSLIETLKLRANGYPVKMTIDDFVAKFRCLLPALITSYQKKSEILQDILDGQGSRYQDDFQKGTVHIFLRERLFELLSGLRKAVIAKSAIVVQKTLKSVLERRRFLKKRRAVTKIQAHCRGWIARRDFLRQREGVMKSLELETVVAGTLRTYRKVAADDALKKKEQVSKSLLGPTRYLGGEDDEKDKEEEIEFKKINDYVPITAEMQRPTIDHVSIEDFAERHCKGHILEVRREPIQTPFLPKESEEDFMLSLEMFKLVLMYTNDMSISKSHLHILARKIINLAIETSTMRDELFVQLCNQTYKNSNNVSAERAWTLILMSVHSFPPSLLVLPMLLHYFVIQIPNLRNMLMEGLVRKIRTLDAQACRLFPANRLEYAAFSQAVPAVVRVHLPDQDEYLVEAHPWATAEEVALRVMRERGMGDPEGWSVVVENEDDVFCPTQGHFLHDAIAALEFPQKSRILNEDVDPIFHFPNRRSLPATNIKRSSSIEPSRRPGSPPRSAPVSRQSSMREDSRSGVARITLSGSPAPLTTKVEMNSRPYERLRRASVDSSSPPESTSSSAPEREVFVDPRNPDSEYCYTLPNKNSSTRKIPVSEESDSPPNNSPTYRPRYYEASENHLYTMSPPPPPLQSLPSQATLDRYHQQQAMYATLPHPTAQQQQYIQYVPVVVSQPVLPQQMYSSPMIPTAMTQMAPQPLYQPIMPNAIQTPPSQQHPSLTPQLSTSSLLFGSDVDERIRAALIRRQSMGSDTANVMSVASRIRRMPVPSKNSDVDRFLDEVFQQVLHPEDLTGMDSISSQRIADSIRGLKKKPSPASSKKMKDLPQQSIYYDTPPTNSGMYHTLQYPMGYNSLPAMFPRATLNRVNAATLSRVDPSSSAEFRRHTDELKRKQFIGVPLRSQYHASANDIDYPQFTNDVYGNQAPMYDAPPMMPVPQFSAVPDAVAPDGNTMMYDVTEVASYGVQSPPSRLTIAEEVDIPMSGASSVYGPTPAPRTVDVHGTIVRNSMLNSEHPNPGKLHNPAKSATRVQAEKERAALAKIAEKQRHLPPPIDEIKISRPKSKPVVPVVVPVAIPEEPKEDIRAPPTPRPPSPVRRRPIVKPILEEILEEIPPEPYRPATKPNPEVVIPKSHPRHVTVQDGDWVYQEVERPKEAQNVLVSRRTEGEIGVQNGAAPLRPFSTQPPQPVKQRTALHIPKQPWKLTIRKLHFMPGELLDDVQVIDQIFAQIIDDCRRAIAYRIRAEERDKVTGILKKHKIPPDLINRQYEIPTDVKIEVITEARTWPLYFNEIFEVIEERATENVFVLLAVGETGIRLLIQNHSSSQSPLTIQDHFEYGDIKDVMLEERHLLTIRTRSNMLVHLRTEQAAQIRHLIETYLYGTAKIRKFAIATSDYITNENDHLSFSRGQRIELVDKAGIPTGWLHGRVHNHYGVFPAEHVVPERIDERGNPSDVPAIRSPYSLYEQSKDEYGYEYAEEGEGRDKYTMLEFALRYFRQPRGDKRKDWTWKDIAQNMMWTDRPMQQSLLQLEAREANKLACDVFTCIMKFMGDEQLKKGETYTDVVYRLFDMLRRLETMRDEAYCQLVRQTTNNKSLVTESANRGWRLFIIVTAFFDCSNVLKPYLMKHLSDVSKDPRRAFHASAKQCLQNLSKTFKYGGRKFLLGGTEIDELSKGKAMKRQLYNLPGGHKKVINTGPSTVVEEIVKELCRELNIRSLSEQQEFVLVAVLERDGDEVYAANNEYVLDICTELEHRKQQFVFFLKRAVWLYPLRLDSALYIDTMFYQILPDYLTGFLVTPQHNGHFSASTLDDIARLAAYVYLSNEESRRFEVDERNVLRLLPHTALTSRIVTAEMWVDRVERKLRTMDTAISLSHARAAFLEIVEKWPTFGAIFFRVLATSEKEREISEMVISINRAGLRLVSADNYRMLAEYGLSSIGQVSRFTRGGSEYLDVTVRGAERDTRLTIQSDKSRDIARLIGHYLYVYNTNKSTIASSDPR